jgi:hypothetical protein
MTNSKLSDMQLILLTTACQREDGSLLPPPDSLGDHTARVRKAVIALIKRGFAAEHEGMAASQAWREEGDIVIGVIVTDAGRAIIEPKEVAPGGEVAAGPGATDKGPVHAGAGQAAPPVVSRPMSKQAMVLDMLKREGGAALTEIVTAIGWLPHTSRAALTGLRKKGHAIVKQKVEGTTRYHIAEAA